MGLLHTETRHLFPVIRGELVRMLDELEPDDWARPTVCASWNVKDVVAHLVGVELSNVSRGRDGHLLDSGPIDDLPAWLERYNAAWVASARRVSTRVLRDLVGTAGSWFDEHLSTLHMDALGGPVSWASHEPAPVWLDVAREYTERWVHQAQIREACRRPGLTTPELLAPVLRTFAHSLPKAFAPVAAADGSAVNVVVDPAPFGEWHLLRTPAAWDLRDGISGIANATVTLTPDGAWRLFTKHPGAPPPAVSGDPAMGDAVAGAVAIIR